MWTARDKSLSFEELKAEAGKAQKDQHLVVVLCRYFFKHMAYIFVMLVRRLYD